MSDYCFYHLRQSQMTKVDHRLMDLNFSTKIREKALSKLVSHRVVRFDLSQLSKKVIS